MSADKIQKTQGRLLMLAALFLGLFALALTLSPAVRARSWEADYRWSHWVGLVIWLIGVGIVHWESGRRIPRRDPYLLPLIALLSGWGLLTIWRLTPYYGQRQTIWLALGLGVLALGLRLPSNLNFLRRYKYLWLTGGLALTTLTLIFGTNPLGYGPRLWLGCCGFYFQPSEPLKLLLIIFLAAYFADWQSILVTSSKSQATSAKTQASSRLQILVPTIIMTGIALMLLVVQRDLGTASIFIFIYAVMVYLATGWRWVPVITALVLAAAGVLGYLLFDVVRIRIEAWINPWLDPTGRSYQIVQSLMAVANGEIFGRGPGMGSPSLVPVAHSDFIFSAIVEETGLVGALGLLVILGLLVHRGLLIAFQVPGAFRRLLAAGLTAFLIGQSVLIIGGNLRLLPLTGVTLPFVSYGGSSLMVSFVVGLLLLQISTQVTAHVQRQPAAEKHRPLLPISAFLLLALAAVALAAGWWAYLRAPDLLIRTDNPRRALDDRYVVRGALLARGDFPLIETVGETGAFSRSYLVPALGPVTGYNHPVYGQAGLEASLDPTLRGLEGNDPVIIAWHHLLYGQSPPGLDVRLTLDMELQSLADELLEGHNGALILLNAKTGEILVMASHPGFDPNQLNEIWDALIQDPDTPLINRVTQGSYPLGNLGEILFGGPAYLRWLGIAPQLRLPLAYEPPGSDRVTPLQVGLAAAALANDGNMPASRLALSYLHPEQGWLGFPPLGSDAQLLTPEEATIQKAEFQVTDQPFWQLMEVPTDEEITWYLGGTIPKESASPFALALVLEEENLPLVEEIGQTLLLKAME
jgi:cell division protein FtsW (lipid II flippase)